MTDDPMACFFCHRKINIRKGYYSLPDGPVCPECIHRENRFKMPVVNNRCVDSKTVKKAEK